MSFFTNFGDVEKTGVCPNHQRVQKPPKSMGPVGPGVEYVATHNDHPSYVKHVLGSIRCLSPHLGIGFVGGGGVLMDWYTTC